ncbi:MAG: hypothetical protein C0606_11845 [Hyphomicrobiales bacterium]|nr:MAG: hypothetical protein C0606_11845 [Hyphomicrobiales bacterium]
MPRDTYRKAAQQSDDRTEQGDTLIVTGNNLAYLVLFWLAIYPATLAARIGLEFLFEDPLSAWSIVDMMWNQITLGFFPYVAVLALLWLSVDYVRILRVQVDRAPGTLVWEKLTMRGNETIIRDLADVQAVVQPHQRLLFPERAHIVFEDRKLPLEIRHILRERHPVNARALADFAGLPFIAN